MIHSSAFKPRCYPLYGDVTPNEVDRLQSISGNLSLNRDKKKEIGRDGTITWKQRIPTSRLSLTQYEYGSMDFYRLLANKASSVHSLTLNDFKTSAVNMAFYETDDNGTFLGTTVYPKLRLASFGVSIGNPNTDIVRSFELVGEDEHSFQEGNAYYNYQRFVAVGNGYQTFSVTGPNPVSDPDISGSAGYFEVVVRVRAGVSTELVYGTDYTFTAPSTLAILSATTGDVYKAYYTAASYLTGLNPFVNNDSDLACISADSCSIYLQTSNYLYRLQSASFNVSFDRTDQFELGNNQIVQTGIKSKTVTISLGRTLESYTIEEVLRNSSSTYGKIDPRKFTNTGILKIKFYSDSTKTVFKNELQFPNISATSMGIGANLDDYISRDITLEGEECIISDVEL